MQTRPNAGNKGRCSNTSTRSLPRISFALLCCMSSSICLGGGARHSTAVHAVWTVWPALNGVPACRCGSTSDGSSCLQAMFGENLSVTTGNGQQDLAKRQLCAKRPLRWRFEMVSLRTGSFGLWHKSMHPPYIHRDYPFQICLALLLLLFLLLAL